MFWFRVILGGTFRLINHTHRKLFCIDGFIVKLKFVFLCVCVYLELGKNCLGELPIVGVHFLVNNINIAINETFLTFLLFFKKKNTKQCNSSLFVWRK